MALKKNSKSVPLHSSTITNWPNQTSQLTNKNQPTFNQPETHLWNSKDFFFGWSHPTQLQRCQPASTNQPHGLQTPGRNGALSELGRVYVSLGGRRLTGRLCGVAGGGCDGWGWHRKRKYVMQIVRSFYETMFFSIVFSSVEIGKILFVFDVTFFAHKGPKRGVLNHWKDRFEVFPRWWFQIYVLFSPLFGEDSHFD